MTSNIPTTISDKAAEVLTQLENWKLIDKQNYTAKPNDAASLFRTWCIDNCVFTDDQTSLDWRLRNVRDFSTRIQRHLDDILVLADKALSGQQEHQNDQMSVDETEIYNPNSSCLLEPGTIHVLVKRLFRVCQRFRESGIVSQISRTGLAFGPLHDKFRHFVVSSGYFRAHVTHWVRIWVPEASLCLFERLVESIVLRRDNFLWLRQLKATGKYPPFPSQVETIASTSELSPADRKNGESREALRNLLLPYPQEIRTAGEIDTSSSSLPQFTRGMIPPAPTPLPSSNLSQCQYCYMVCHRDQLEGENWINHFLRDLMPYICVLEDCPSFGTILFQTRKEWLDHMVNQHPMVRWKCTNRAHSQPIEFTNASKCQNHMDKEHPIKVEEINLGYRDDCEMSRLRRSRRNPLTECPFCKDGLKADTPPPEILSHVEGHLLELVMLSIPEEIIWL